MPYAVRLEMEELEQVSDNQVILAWLQAEIESPGFQIYVVGDPPEPANLSRAMTLARKPDLDNAEQNAARREIIGAAHGFGRGAMIFAGLSDDITWRRARLTVSDVASMLYSNRSAGWTTLAPATRTVGEGAANAARVFSGDDTNMHILSLARTICHAEAAPALSELICLRLPDGGISVVEGHTRATAIVMEAHKLPRGVEAFVGDSPSIANWAYL